MDTIYILLFDAAYYYDDCLFECDPECFGGAFSTEDKAKAAVLEEYNKHYDGRTKSEFKDDLEVISWKEEWENADGYWLYEYYVIKVAIDKLWNGD